MFIFLLSCSFIATLKCSRASLAPGMRNLSGATGRSALGVVSWTVTKIMCKYGPIINNKKNQFGDVSMNRDGFGFGFASAACLMRNLF